MRPTRTLAECGHGAIRQAKRGFNDLLKYEFEDGVNRDYEKIIAIFYDYFRRMREGGGLQRVRKLRWAGSSKGMDLNTELQRESTN
jgi:hypothetical protein